MPPSDSAFARAVRDLHRGLFETTAVSWIGVLVFCVAELAACCLLVAPRRLAALDPRYLMDSQGDEYCSLSIRLMRLRFSRPRGLEVVYVGGSQATRALATRDPDRLSRELSRATRARVTFNVMSANNQRYEDALGISDQLPRSYRGAFVMMVSDYKDDYGKPGSLAGIRSRIAFTSAPSLLPFWQDVGNYRPPHTGLFFLDHFGFFAARRRALLRLEPVPGTGIQGAGGIKPGKRAEAFAKLEEQQEEALDDGPNPIKRKLRQHAPILAKSRRLMVTLISNLKRRGILPVFVEFPHQPLRHEIFKERNDRFQQEFAQFAERHHVVYWDLNPEMDLSVDDFQDQVHLGSLSGRRQFQTALMGHLGPLLRERFIEGDASANVEDLGDAPDHDAPAADDPGVDDDDDEPDLHRAESPQAAGRRDLGR